MNWHVPTTALCPRCATDLGDVLGDREAYVHELQGRGVRDMDTLRKDIAEREDRVFREALESIVRGRHSKGPEPGHPEQGH